MRVHLGKADLAPGEMRGHDVGRGRLVLLARVGSRWFAIDDWCNHAGARLSEGTLDGGVVRCPLHGMTFDVRTGALACAPRLCGDQRVYPVEIDEGEVWIDLEG